MENKDEQLDNGLVKAIENGVASAEQIAEMSRLLQISLVSDMLTGQKQLMGTVSPFIALQEKAQAKLMQVLEVDVESMDRDDLMKLIEFTQKNSLNVLEMQRKLVQGKELLSAYPQLTAEERAVITLMKQFKTPEEKKLFMDALKSAATTSGEATARDASKAKETQSDDDFDDTLPQ